MSAPGVVVWFTGLPSSGKSTLAARVRARLQRPAALLDGDEVREALVPRPGYTPHERDAFYATLSRLAALLAKQGLVVLVAATAHRRMYRLAARALAPNFIEVALDVPEAECKARDAKGLYAASTSSLPGGDLAYEPPEFAEVTARGGEDPAAVDAILALIG